MESRKRKQTAFPTTQKLVVLRYEALHPKQAIAGHFIVLWGCDIKRRIVV